MTHQVLARKWRPKSFTEMIGQETTLRTLSNALTHERLHHAYLLTGTRGVGKTSLGRILAKCLNCEKGISPHPCGTCAICIAIDEGRFVDLQEIDAASRTKVEDTRELLDNVHYAPTIGRFRIYLIDEVHMLSGHSFNALLKTLEEPPAHVKFILATTEPKRLPITILSRCLQFHLKRIPDEQMTDHLAHICTSEGIEFEPAALGLISKAADGSLRDALSLTDQAIAYCANHINVADTQQMLGAVDQDQLYPLLNALQAGNGQALYTALQQLTAAAPDYQQVLNELLSLLQHIARAQLIPDIKSFSEKISSLAKTFSQEDVQLYYQIALIGKRDLSLAPNPIQGFEMIMLRMLAFKPVMETAPMAPVREKGVASPAQSIVPTTENWSTLLPQLGLTGLAQALASNCSLVEITGAKVKLALAAHHQPMLNNRLVERIEAALSKVLGKPYSVEITITADPLTTPAKEHEQNQAIRKTQATEAIKSDAHVQKILDVFDAKLDIDSIKAIES